LDDAPAARVVRRLLRLPGYEVFKYITENGTIADIRRADITAYIKEHMGAAFSAKDFRTWTATLICACALARALHVTEKNERARRRTIVAALRETATLLGNTAAVCRSSYVSPCVLSAFHAGSVVDTPAAAGDLATMPTRRLRGCERALLRLLRSSTRLINPCKAPR
jgi:DNA topoisomerase-1